MVFRSLLGINAAAPGFEKILIKPQPAGDLTWAKGNYHSVYGNIGSDWKKEAGGFSLRVSIPANTTAEVWLPAKENSIITESGNSVNSIKDIKFKGYKNGYAVMETGSGDYYFLSQL